MSNEQGAPAQTLREPDAHEFAPAQPGPPAPGGHDSERLTGPAPIAPAHPVTTSEAAPAGGTGDEPAAPEGRRSAGTVPPKEIDELRPAEIVRRLDEYIVGQDAAKRAMAVALRNRIRRQRLPEEIRAEVMPKNILLIGPTGVGKTEIARRLARMTRSPFLKVEATKFTEVGYVGRDVESIVRDLLEQTITEIQNDRVAEVEGKARELAEERIVDVLLAVADKAANAPVADQPSPAGGIAAVAAAPAVADAAVAEQAGPGAPTRGRPTVADPVRHRRLRRRRLLKRLAAHKLDDRVIEIEVEEAFQPAIESFSGTGMEDVGVSLSDFFSQLAPPRKRLKRMTVADARNALAQEETDHLVDIDRVYDDSIRLVEDSGIVFIDEVDKICGSGSEHGPDVSGEGVQRDLLPLLEGSSVHTRYGALRTDHILYVAAGAFNVARPSELIPEFQGRFPIRVELTPLSETQLRRILVEPGNALTKQYAALLGTEDVTLDFSEDGLTELAHQAALVNQQDENIGARRLFTVMEKVLEDLSFRAEEFAGQRVTVDAAMVRERLTDLVRNDDLRRYVL